MSTSTSASALRRIVVTPAGRQRYLEVLLPHLRRQHGRGAFERWDLWLNTNVAADIAYCKSLAAAHAWIAVVELAGIDRVSNSNICKFFKHACDPACVYVRVDDDVVYVQPDFFETLFTYRVSNPAPFLVYANIVNNAVIAHIHQRNARVRYPQTVGYACMDPVGWRDPLFAEALHRAFLADAQAGRVGDWRKSFDTWVCWGYERVSINCIAWLGATFAEFAGEVGRDEEQWLSVEKPRELGRPNVLLGSAVAAHFSFYTQREHLDATDILDQYARLARQEDPAAQEHT